MIKEEQTPGCFGKKQKVLKIKVVNDGNESNDNYFKALKE